MSEQRTCQESRTSYSTKQCSQYQALSNLLRLTAPPSSSSLCSKHHYKWAQWTNQATHMWHCMLDANNLPKGFNYSRKMCVSLNRIRTNHGRCGTTLFKRRMRESPVCDCGAATQTITQIVFESPQRAFQGKNDDIL